MVACSSRSLAVLLAATTLVGISAMQVPLAKPNRHAEKLQLHKANDTIAKLNATKAKVVEGQHDVVQVDIHYEAMCPYCREFFTTAIAPILKDKEMQKRLDIRLHPYGNAQTVDARTVSKGYHFWHAEYDQEGYNSIFVCQHGPVECFGNLVSVCAMDTLKTPEVYLPFILCIEARDTESVEMSSYDCAQEQGIQIDKVRECVKGPQGNMLLEAKGKLIRGLEAPAGPAQYVPWIIVDGKHSQKSEMDAEPGYDGHFMEEVCSLLAEPRPDACATSMVKSAASCLSPLFVVAMLLAAALA